MQLIYVCFAAGRNLAMKYAVYPTLGHADEAFLGDIMEGLQYPADSSLHAKQQFNRAPIQRTVNLSSAVYSKYFLAETPNNILF